MTEELKRKCIEISLKWAKISHYAGPEEFILVLETSLEYARKLNDETKIAHLNYWLAQRNYMIGNLKQAIEHFYSRCLPRFRWFRRVAEFEQCLHQRRCASNIKT